MDGGGTWTGWLATATTADNVVTFDPTVAGVDSLVYTIADDAN